MEKEKLRIDKNLSFIGLFKNLHSHFRHGDKRSPQ